MHFSTKTIEVFTYTWPAQFRCQDIYIYILDIVDGETVLPVWFL